jgi:hypothetical protein
MLELIVIPENDRSLGRGGGRGAYQVLVDEVVRSVLDDTVLLGLLARLHSIQGILRMKKSLVTSAH